MVCFWHFVHLEIPTSYVPSFFALSWFEEGHTGVALFMVLSGYLFTRIVGDGKIDLRAFATNRVLRLAPLLIVAFCFYLAIGQATAWDILGGFVLPTWPGGAWSVTAELHFYLLFPLLLFAVRRQGTFVLALVLVLMLVVRYLLWMQLGEVQRLAYWTIVGRMDQFVWGMVLAILVNNPTHAQLRLGTIALVTLLLFLMFWHVFNIRGGYYFNPAYPSTSPYWIFLPSVEGVAYATLIAWYETSSLQIPSLVNRVLATIGTVSFSIYLWHWPMRLPVQRIFLAMGFEGKTFLEASVLSILFFVVVVLASIASYRLIEKPFLSLRKSYRITGGLSGQPQHSLI